jgi:hypothetical protein
MEARSVREATAMSPKNTTKIPATTVKSFRIRDIRALLSPRNGLMR